MTNLIVISDSHGDADSIRRIIASEKNIGAVMYLGDGVRDMECIMEEYKGLRYYPVSGNCDFHSLYPREALAPFEKVVVYYTHGHIHGVKYDTEALAKAARARGATLALYGHTHQISCTTHDGLTLFNPGSCGRCYTGPDTYGVICIADGKIISAEHKPVPAAPVGAE